MTFRKFSKRATLVSVLLGILLASSVAFAAWTATGTGDGSAKAISATAITVTGTTATADLYPGKTQGNLYVSFANPNPYAVSLTTITPGAVTVDGAHATCNFATVSLDGAYPQLPLALAANDGSAGGPDEFAGPLNSAVTMTTAANDNCQGATFTINFTISGIST